MFLAHVERATRQRPPRRLTSAGQRNTQAAWSPRGDRIAFLAKREQQGAKDEVAQLYLMSPDGGEAARVAEVLPGIEAFRWLPDGSGIVYAAWVWPDLKTPKAQARRWRRPARSCADGGARWRRRRATR